jgi:hypothetical protein
MRKGKEQARKESESAVDMVASHIHIRDALRRNFLMYTVSSRIHQKRPRPLPSVGSCLSVICIRKNLSGVKAASVLLLSLSLSLSGTRHELTR